MHFQGQVYLTLILWCHYFCFLSKACLHLRVYYTKLHATIAKIWEQDYCLWPLYTSDEMRMFIQCLLLIFFFNDIYKASGEETTQWLEMTF